ncbi:hypothetical protein PFICI_07072 [Pestalotiopsis fici W106-1]|uniref:PH domain-containing protein n=1 Tax=Pestalotiopsis fici (strain W106-1 / CGMCC3.15140) TaxID=1229662 RepID=W3X7N9_PESFW|nr:uncharacterized protein PFICI_07072 [Pestalotiopsis fici W106-1]ETS82070.1 hypothetical protein PFICI_07072 [Pestalotiopsis fici W106-1]
MDHNDPFGTDDYSPDDREPRHRYSTFDTQLFALGSNASPAQAKRALEAHLAETDRRMEEAGKLGTALVQQRKQLTQRIEEIEKLHAEAELSQDLREKLAEIERDYNDVARESAKAFLPKPRVPSNEAAAASGERRSVSPSKFEAQGGSPTKLTLPNRKLRNQPANRVHDIEFAAEISQSLIVQVRNLQALLSEKEEELKDVKIEKSKLEYDAESFQQRLKSLDESQNRYKDENWSLETQIHELSAAQRESADREKKLQQTVSILQAEKNTTQRELDEVKLNHSKLAEEHAAAVKHHDTELGAAKRNIVIAESERTALLRKVEDLTGQNQELAKAVSAQRGRALDRPEAHGTSDEDFQTANDNDTPEHSPPPSPIKGTPRHSLLESETLKTSLSHAQRTIQSLRTNVHREKTEKLELRRMLQDARDELEKVRADPMPSSKRERPSKATSRDFKKPPRLLGALRSARSEIFAPAEDPEWEDQTPGSSPDQTAAIKRRPSQVSPVIESVETDNFETANETSDQAFETANERDVETDDFHTVAEEFSSDDTQTETESPSKRATLRARPPLQPLGHGRNNSIHSTASTEDEYGFDDSRPSSSHFPPLQTKFPLRLGRGARRRSRQGSEDTIFRGSSSAFANESNRTPQPNQSLAAELGDFDGSDNDSNLSATPSKRSIRLSRPGSMRGPTASPPPPMPYQRRNTMVESGTMTEPFIEFAPSFSFNAATSARPASAHTVVSRVSDISDTGTAYLDESHAKFPSSPSSGKRDFAVSNVHANDLAPIEETDMHIAELEQLREAHAKQIEELHSERNAAHVSALAALEAQHADLIDRAIAEARSSHERELEILKSDHSNDKSGALAAAHEAHARELETLRSSHADDKTTAIAAAKAAHLHELEKLQSTHNAKIAQAESDYQAAHDRELEALKASHAQQLEVATNASKESHAAELESLAAAHAAQIERARKEVSDSHAQAVESLKAGHNAQVELAMQSSDAAHAADLERLKASHLDQIKQVRDAMNADIEHLRTSHLAQLEQVRGDVSASHAQELEALKATHTSQVEQLKKDNDAAHAAELAALAALHAKQLDTSNADNEARLAKELDVLATSHREQLETSRTEADAQLTKQLGDIKAAHADELSALRTESDAKLVAELSALKLAHSNALESSQAEAENKLAQEIRTLQGEHARQLENVKSEEAARLALETESLRAAHARNLEELEKEKDKAHASELAALNKTHAAQLEQSLAKRDAAHSAELAALASTHDKQLAVARSEAEATLARELASLKGSHASELETIRSEHAATHAKELETFEAALAKQLESTKSEGNAAHNEQIQALKAANAEIVDAHKRDSQQALEKALESARASHDRELENLRSEHMATQSRHTDELSSKHAGELAALEAALVAAKATELQALSSQHDQHVASVEDEHVKAKAAELSKLTERHEKELESAKAEAAATKTKELAALTSSHQQEIELLRAEGASSKDKAFQELVFSHQQEMESLQATASASRDVDLKALSSRHEEDIAAIKAEAATLKAQDMESLKATHTETIKSLKAEHEDAVAKLAAELAASHALALETLRSEHETSRSADLGELDAKHIQALDDLRRDHEVSRNQALDQLKSEHSAFLATVRTDHQSSMDAAIEDLQTSHAKAVASLKDGHATSLQEALSAIQFSHATELASLKSASDAALVDALEKANTEHAHALEAQQAQSLAERDRLLASHAQELEDLRKALTLIPPTLGYSAMSSIETEPIAEPESLRSPKRDAFILPRDLTHPQTPPYSTTGVMGKKSKGTDTPIIAEDETRQSPTATNNSPETPESQRPFKEMSTNTDVRPARRTVLPTADHGAQTALTSDGIDKLLSKTQRRGSQDSMTLGATAAEIIITPSDERSYLGIYNDQPQDKGKNIAGAANSVPARRPGSSSSARGSQQTAPPLPANHREAIEAARTGSSHGTKTAMGPPLLPASAYKNPRDRPQSPLSGRGTPTPRATRTGSTQGLADVQSSAKLSVRSRQSSVSSFASEIESRFNIRNEMGIGASSFAGPNTDPRMIQAITQTMIGEYLWKYTRKAGRGEMSENRHRRYFWVHPYTRTLYWSDRDPAVAGRSELRAKSIPIEAVRVVADDNPMPPGLHRKSLVIVSPGRTVKFTCTTGQRHETWFNALSYLLLRTGDESHADAEDLAGNITQEDVDEFNPPYGASAVNGNRRAPPSLSSYNSRTTRNESPNLEASMTIPTLTPTRERDSAVRPGTLGRLSGYLNRTSTSGSIFSTLRSRSHGPPAAHGSAIYEASEVNDSAEELRQIIEQQERESDRLENVRACCDGKHDVGTLSRSSKRNRSAHGHSHNHSHSHSHSHSHPEQSTTPTPMSTIKARS